VNFFVMATFLTVANYTTNSGLIVSETKAMSTSAAARFMRRLTVDAPMI
jgi:hypothetical protein